VVDLLERAVHASGGKGHVRVRAEVEAPPLDSALMEFAWSAFVTLETDVRGRAPECVELAIEPAADAGRALLSVTVCDDESEDRGALGPPVELARFLAESGEDARPESRHALRLAADVLELHGGVVEVRGRAGAGAMLSVTLPRSA
jgi:signal transduction histidine kinase